MKLERYIWLTCAAACVVAANLGGNFYFSSLKEQKQTPGPAEKFAKKEEEPKKTEVKIEPAKPVPPRALTATALSPSSIELRWNSSEGSVEIERSGSGQSFARIETVRGQEYTDKGLSPGAGYNYRVRVSTNGQYSDYSDAASASTPPSIPDGKPSVPTKLAATADSSSPRINLTWEGAGPQFELERRETGGSARSFKTPQRQYSDSELKADTEYTYRVRALDVSDRSSDYSPAVTARTAKMPSGDTLLVVLLATQALDLKDETLNKELAKIETANAKELIGGTIHVADQGGVRSRQAAAAGAANGFKDDDADKTFEAAFKAVAQLAASAPKARVYLIWKAGGSPDNIQSFTPERIKVPENPKFHLFWYGPKVDARRPKEIFKSEAYFLPLGVEQLAQYINTF